LLLSVAALTIQVAPSVILTAVLTGRPQIRSTVIELQWPHRLAVVE
jgi:hypothetical protein